MKRILVVSILALIFAMTGIAWGTVIAKAPEHHPIPITCTVQGLRPFAKKVWDLNKWERDSLPPAVVEAYKKRLACAPPHHKVAMKRTWHKAKRNFRAKRKKELFRVRVTPYKCGDSWWATECTIPEHESGYGTGGSNLYGLKDAWALHGCTAFGPTAESVSKHYQDICASRHWHDFGRSGWPAY